MSSYIIFEIAGRATAADNGLFCRSSNIYLLFTELKRKYSFLLT
jgi:hypothetical protein